MDQPIGRRERMREQHRLTFQPNHTVHGKFLAARSALTNGAIHLVGSMPSGPIEKTLTISQADAISFKIEGD